MVTIVQWTAKVNKQKIRVDKVRKQLATEEKKFSDLYSSLMLERLKKDRANKE